MLLFKSKNLECLGQKRKQQSLIKEYTNKRKIDDTSIVSQELQSEPLNLNEIFHKMLRKGTPINVIFNEKFVTN
ncbi:unnamed protein product [Paramecium sonneborni]|uniref:Uncharacterized protein n=1 Tax=Paramecium sonneborni TaxID=65129 RepID=A0A8S1P442_9CILI|nr:unnamed protein product [Paramecium sonneborni]